MKQENLLLLLITIVMTKLNDEIEHFKKVIDSCLTYEQLIVAQKWVLKTWEDEDILLFFTKKIEEKERQLGETGDNSPLTISIRRRIH